ncbi:hypothetical protein NEOKW01_1732 [Nematocida sp. AWRm80]|nr:hypothetical protein NEOKW01_1732 [Nematocida sp. AWRm80]
MLESKHKNRCNIQSKCLIVGLTTIIALQMAVIYRLLTEITELHIIEINPRCGTSTRNNSHKTAPRKKIKKYNAEPVNTSMDTTKTEPNTEDQNKSQEQNIFFSNVDSLEESDACNKDENTCNEWVTVEEWEKLGDHSEIDSNDSDAVCTYKEGSLESKKEISQEDPPTNAEVELQNILGDNYKVYKIVSQGQSKLLVIVKFTNFLINPSHQKAEAIIDDYIEKANAKINKESTASQQQPAAKVKSQEKRGKIINTRRIKDKNQLAAEKSL